MSPRARSPRDAKTAACHVRFWPERLQRSSEPPLAPESKSPRVETERVVKVPGDASGASRRKHRMNSSPARAQLTMSSIDTIFPDEWSCFKFLADARFGTAHLCPHCHVSAPFYRITVRHFRCRICRTHVSPTAGTIFLHSKIPLRSWFQCVFLTCIARPGISGGLITRFLGIHKAAAWRMASLIRLQMARLSDDRVFGGSGQRVELDETLIKHLRDRKGGPPPKVTVFGISDGEHVWTCRVQNRSRKMHILVQHV